jgi:hypothetical protein
MGQNQGFPKKDDRKIGRCHQQYEGAPKQAQLNAANAWPLPRKELRFHAAPLYDNVK